MCNKNYVIKILVCLIIFCSTFRAIASEKIVRTNTDQPIIIAFTRHTFRGVSKTTPPPVITIPHLKIKNTILSYGMDATHDGLLITKKFAEQAYNDGAKLALKTIRQNPKIAGHWSQIRTDLSSERTFLTAVNLDEGLSKILSQKISLVGCQTSEERDIDDISTVNNQLRECISHQLIKQQRALMKEKVSKRFIMLANHLLLLLGGQPIINKANYHLYFSPVENLCAQIEMSADLGDFPLQYVLKNPVVKLSTINHKAVATALKLLGYELLIDAANSEMNASTLTTLNYIDTLKPGTQKIVVSHDTKMNALLSNLNLISAHSSPSALSIYPIETITIAMNSKLVTIVRTRIKINKNGAMNGKAGFKSWIFWSGTRTEWNSDVNKLRIKVNNDKKMVRCIQKIPLCHPVKLQYNLLRN